ncbi:hypothetical protein LX36DRAFT_400572 [Colletotrichum falcatum]|nr:hypothetical protein LX36DRAFT_400572 [Colletotrichum falcatum]
MLVAFFSLRPLFVVFCSSSSVSLPMSTNFGFPSPGRLSRAAFLRPLRIHHPELESQLSMKLDMLLVLGDKDFNGRLGRGQMTGEGLSIDASTLPSSGG